MSDSDSRAVPLTDYVKVLKSVLTAAVTYVTCTLRPSTAIDRVRTRSVAVDRRRRP